MIEAIGGGTTQTTATRSTQATKPAESKPAAKSAPTPAAPSSKAVYQQASKAQSLLSNYSAGPSSRSATAAQNAALTPTKNGWSTVKQGDVGDCYFVSAMVDEAKNDPSDIRNLIKPDADGKYTVDFHGMSPVTVNGKGVTNGVQGEGKWSQILEQAWETHQGNITSNGGADDWGSAGSAPALEALTGQKYGERSSNLLQEGVSSGLTSQITQDVRNGQDVTAATSGIGPALGLSSTQGGLVGDHVYSVVGANSQGDLEIRNPWGTDKNGNGNGEQWVTPQQFGKDFDDVTVPGSSDAEGAVGIALFNGLQDLKPEIQGADKVYNSVASTVSSGYDDAKHAVSSFWNSL